MTEHMYIALTQQPQLVLISLTYVRLNQDWFSTWFKLLFRIHVLTLTKNLYYWAIRSTRLCNTVRNRFIKFVRNCSVKGNFTYKIYRLPLLNSFWKWWLPRSHANWMYFESITWYKHVIISLFDSDLYIYFGSTSQNIKTTGSSGQPH